MNVWRSESVVLSPKEKKVELLFHFLLDHKVPGIGNHIGKTFSLNRFIQVHQREPDLHTRILVNGKPLFTKTELGTFLRAGQKQSQKQSGGGYVKSAGTEFYDKLYNKILQSIPNMSSLLPGCFESMPSLSTVPFLTPFLQILDYYFFLLYHVEQLPIVGPAVFSPGLDAVTLGIPVASEVVASGITLAAAFVPIPGVGTGAEAVTTLTESLLSFVATVLNISRRQFGSAFKTGLGIIPKFGDAIEESAQQLEIGLMRIQARMNKVSEPLRAYTPTGHAVLTQYIPSVEEAGTTVSVPLTIETAKQIKQEIWANLEKQAAANPSIKKAMDGLDELTSTFSNIVPPEVLAPLEKGDVPGAMSAVRTIVTLPPKDIALKLGASDPVAGVVGQISETTSKIKDIVMGLIGSSLPSMPSLPSLPYSLPISAAANNKPANNKPANNTQKPNESKPALQAENTQNVPTVPTVTTVPTSNSIVPNNRTRKTSFAPTMIRKRPPKRKTRRYSRR